MATNGPKPKRTKPKLVRASAAKETVRQRAEKASREPRRRKITSATNSSRGAAKGVMAKSFKIHDEDDSSKLKTQLTKHRSPLPKYIRGSFAEIRLVQWPGFKKAVALTFAVFVFAISFAAVVSGLDWLLGQAFDELILNQSQNIKDFISNTF